MTGRSNAQEFADYGEDVRSSVLSCADHLPWIHLQFLEIWAFTDKPGSTGGPEAQEHTFGSTS